MNAAVLEQLARLEAMPIMLSNGSDLQDWLARETTLGPKGAPQAIKEYRRFLAMALSAPAGEITVPSPLADQVWRLHIDDATAWEGFCATIGGARVRRHAQREDARLHAAKAKSLERHGAAFGPAQRRDWLPKQRRFALRLWFLGIGLLIGYLALQANGGKGSGLFLALVLAVGGLVFIAETRPDPAPFRIYGPARVPFALSPKVSE